MKFWVAGYEDPKSPPAEQVGERPATEIFESIFGKRKPATPPRRVRFEKFVIRRDSFEEVDVAAEPDPNSGSPSRSPTQLSPKSCGSLSPPMLPSLIGSPGRRQVQQTRMYSDFPNRPTIPLRSGSKAGDVRIEPYNRARAMEEGKHLEHLERISKRRFWLAIWAALLMIVAVVLVVTLPRRDQHSATRGGAPSEDGAAPVDHGAYSHHPCIQTRAELYNAVDLFLADPRPNATVALVYGHPIGAWCLDDSLHDLTAVFSAARNPRAVRFDWDLSGWDTSRVRVMEDLFRGAAAFNRDLSGWDTGLVENMAGLFRGAAAFDGDVSTWNTSRVTTFERMFQGAAAFNGDVSGWDLGAATNTRAMFRGATSLHRDLCRWGQSLNATVAVTKMFAETPSCKAKGSEAPVLGAAPYGPFCFPCH